MDDRLGRDSRPEETNQLTMNKYSPTYLLTLNMTSSAMPMNISCMYVVLPRTAPMEMSGAATATSASRRLEVEVDVR